MGRGMGAINLDHPTVNKGLEENYMLIRNECIPDPDTWRVVRTSLLLSGRGCGFRSVTQPSPTWFPKHSTGANILGVNQTLDLTLRISIRQQETGDKMTKPKQTQGADDYLADIGIFSGSRTGPRAFLTISNFI